ncbi:non-ribosomal peptide synthetase [Chitinophaga flava]|uniref:Carrier domain-containing protein n=1 Tax=Chitinophaga flava TaxID=2259036 RepID=A0A365XVG1_9BACT|nr:non-ribosomal peptide synthetase [Chitinophaga flava]RBL90352.1 hypothetical protein DF182_28230 [Chitinophaga flava]
MMEVFIDKLINLNIDIELVDQDKLKIHMDIAKIPDDILAEIKLRKEELITYLKERQTTDDFKKIPVTLTRDNYILSSTQRRLWILSQFEESNVAYNVQRAYVCEGELNLLALEYSFNKLIERHEILRTGFKEDEQREIKQFIYPPEEIGFRLSYQDVRHEKESAVIVKELVHQALVEPFDLSSGLLLRAGLFQVDDNKWVFTYVIHHIISDAWSMDILINELFLFYNAYLKEDKYPLIPLRIQYKDYAAWQHEQLSGNTFENHKAYWLKQFEGELPVLELPCDKIRPAVKTYNGASVSKRIHQEDSNRLKGLIQEEGSTLFMGLLAVANALFYRYTNQKDIIIGTPVAGREHVDLGDQLGFYVNTLALRIRFDGENSYRELLDHIRQITLDAYEHQVYPFDELVDELRLLRDISRNPLFDVQVIVQNTAAGNTGIKQTPEGLSVNDYDETVFTNSVFDMVLLFIEDEEGINLNIGYNRDVYSEWIMLQLADHLTQMVKAIIACPDKPIHQLDFLTENNKTALLTTFNDTVLVYPEQKTLVHLFEEQAERTPDSIAVVSGNKTLTYRQLNEKANWLAGYLLKAYQVRPDELVGIMLDRSEVAIIAILGVLKSGAAYVPIDPGLPKARKSFIINDTGIEILILQAESIFDLDYYHGKVLAIDIELDKPDIVVEPAGVIIRPESLAYVIYTSGSTGEPKGVMVEHRAVANSIQSQQAIFGLKAGERLLQFFSFSFDVCVFEIFTAIVSGATLYIINEEEKKSPPLLEAFLINNRIDVASVTPPYLKLLQIEKIHTLKRLIIGGETLNFETIEPFMNQVACYNVYGPTESSIAVSVFNVNENTHLRTGNVPIGTPISNIQLYITDDHNNLVPPGVAGEICIGGAGLARGYLNDPDLTAEKFIPNPFKAGEKMYKTGDLGKWIPGGNIEFAGRKDDQVKIRGHRVELGEVTQALLGHPSIDAAIIVTGPDTGGGKELVAYIVSKEILNVSEIQSYLSTVLPAYMLPAHFVQLDQLPLTPHGKIDKKKLPDPRIEGMSTGMEYIAARNETEEKMVTIWQEILGKSRIGVKDDYFELGGSSLKAMMLVKKVMDETGQVLPLKVLFEQKNIENVSKYIDSANDIITDIVSYSNTPEDDSGLTDVSYNQLIFFSEWNYADDVVITLFEFEYMDVVALKSAMDKLAERHEILRTVFVRIGGTITQKVLPVEEIAYEIANPVTISFADEMNDIIAKEYFSKFDLYTSPLFSVKVYKIENGNYNVLVTIHHIITDGYSRGVLQEELAALYTGILQGKEAELEPLPFQYLNFSVWQKNFVNSLEGIRHKEYWLEKLDGFKPAIKLSSATGNEHKKAILIGISKAIDGTFYEDIDRVVKEHGVTRTVVFMSALTLLFNHWSGQDDITIFTTVSGRNSKYYGELDVSKLIGFFSNLLMVRNVIDKDMSVVKYLQMVQYNFLDDLSYDDYPVEKLINELPGVVPSAFLDASVIYNYHNYEHYLTSVYQVEESEKIEERRGEMPMNLAFILVITEYKNCLVPQLTFNGNLFDHVQIKTIKDLYFSILKEIVYSPQLSIRQMLARIS